MSRKRQREKSAVNTELVEIYDDLANEDGSIRLKAAHSLLTKFVSGPEKDDGQLGKILQRLLRGLCSGRKAARIGFSIALTEFLTELLGSSKRVPPPFQDILGVIGELKNQTTITSGVSGQEVRDHLLGRLFGAEAIIQSGVLFQDIKGTFAWAELLGVILELATKKAWLREECGYMLYSTVQGSRLPKHEPQFAQTLVQKLESCGLTKTPEGIAIWLAVQAKHPAVTLPSNIWHCNDPLNRKERAKLVCILKEAVATNSADATDDHKIAQTGQWHPKVHFAWHAIIPQLMSMPSPKLRQNGINLAKRITFKEFWDACVDDSLFAESSSEERKYRGFLLVQQLLLKASSSQISDILGQHFMHCFMNQLASPDRYLHRAAEKTRRTLLDRAKRDSCIITTILAILLTPPKGDINFDGFTKTKTVEVLLSQINRLDSIDECVTILDSLIRRPGSKDNKSSESKRQILADQMVNLLRPLQSGSITDQSMWIMPVLSTLAKYAYFDVDSSDGVERSEPAISAKSREMFRSRISSGFSHLITNKSIDSSRFAYLLITDINQSRLKSTASQSLVEVDGKIQQLLNDAWETLTYINKERKRESTFQAATLMLSLTVLQVYNGDVDAVSVLDELIEIYNEKQLKHHGQINAQATTALVDILMSLLSKPSLLFRRLSQQVFTACTTKLDENDLQSMLKVLDSKESIVGQAEMFDQEGEDMNESDASEVDEVDMANGTPASISEESDNATQSDETDPSDVDTDDFSDGSDEELAVFDAKLARALGIRPGQNDIDAEENSSSDEDMDDEQMEKLDEHLESMFRERKKLTSKKTEKKDAKETIINFKCRVVELLEIYVKYEHSGSTALSLLLPILSVIRNTGSPLVSRKACDLIREYARLCKGAGLPKIVEAEPILDLLRNVHDEAGKGASNAHASACSQASLLLVRILVADDREHLRKIIKVYTGTQEKALFDPGFRIKTSLFTDWLNWCNSFKK